MIYTKTGDKGTTSLASGQRVAKTDARIEAYGTVDELNSWIGLLRAERTIEDLSHRTNPLPDGVEQIEEQLTWIQNKLFNLGAELSEAPGVWIAEGDVHRVEHWIDAMQAIVPQQRAFLLPVGSEAVCRCHVARTVCRRAERRMIECKAGELNLQFINRLSDYLFVLSRFIAFLNGESESAWKKD